MASPERYQVVGRGLGARVPKGEGSDEDEEEEDGNQDYAMRRTSAEKKAHDLELQQVGDGHGRGRCVCALTAVAALAAVVSAVAASVAVWAALDVRRGVHNTTTVPRGHVRTPANRSGNRTGRIPPADAVQGGPANRTGNVAPPDAVPGGPAKRRTSYPWSEAVGHFFNVTEPQLRDSAHEVLWSSGAPHKCGSPCVASCIVGEFREPRNTPPDVALQEWARMVDASLMRFSAKTAVVFGVWAVGGMSGDRGWVRNPYTAPSYSRVEVYLRQLQPARAVITEERCRYASCYLEQSRMRCPPKDYPKLDKYFLNGDSFFRFYGQCDIQVDRVEQCLELVREYEHDHSMRFDWVTRERLDPRWVPNVPAGELNTGFTYVANYCEAGGATRSCFGGMDWWLAMPREHADVVAGFRDGITCNHLDREEILGVDPATRVRTDCHRSLGCEGWLASWLYGNRIPFAPMGCCWQGEEKGPGCVHHNWP